MNKVLADRVLHEKICIIVRRSIDFFAQGVGMRMAKEGEKQVLNGFSESELCLMKRFCIQIKENIAAMPAPEFSPEEMCMGHFCHNKK